MADRQLSARRQLGERRPSSGLVWLSLCLVALLGCSAEIPKNALPPIPPLAPGTARVWFLRGWDAPSGQGFVFGAAPTIYANGTPIGTIPTGTDFFRDFPPGTYRFTVEPIGLPTGQATTLQLTAGTLAYLQVQWVASWQFGFPERDFSFAPNTFAIMATSEQVAQVYLPTLTHLGQR